MEAKLLNKKLYNIKLSETNPALNLFASKNSFIDKNLTSLKDVYLEISSIGNREYGISSKDFYDSLKKSNDIHIFDNGILLINNLFKQIKRNFVIFLRLKRPILYNGDNSLDLIFALIAPQSIKTAAKLQMLSKLSIMLKKNNIRKKIKGTSKAEDVLALLLPSIKSKEDI